jgi:hypothetical protein
MAAYHIAHTRDDHGYQSIWYDLDDADEEYIKYTTVVPANT